MIEIRFLDTGEEMGVFSNMVSVLVGFVGWHDMGGGCSILGAFIIGGAF